MIWYGLTPVSSTRPSSAPTLAPASSKYPMSSAARRVWEPQRTSGAQGANYCEERTKDREDEHWPQSGSARPDGGSGPGSALRPAGLCGRLPHPSRTGSGRDWRLRRRISLPLLHARNDGGAHWLCVAALHLDARSHHSHPDRDPTTGAGDAAESDL